MAQQKPRIERRPLDGVLLLDKPCGMTSNTALQCFGGIRCGYFVKNVTLYIGD